MAAFRFAAPGLEGRSPPRSGGTWRGKAEDLGLLHPLRPRPSRRPVVADGRLAVAAEATTTLRVGTLVLDNDFRHPVLVAKEAATLDIADRRPLRARAWAPAG